MDNSSNETNVQVAPTVSEVSGKPDNQGKRGAENILDKVVIAKKQKKETKEVPSKRKLETNSSNDETLSDLGEEEDTPEAAEKHTAPDANLEKKQESCPSESDADEDDAFEDSSNFEESFEKSSDENEDVTMKDATVDSAQKQTKMSEKKVPKTPTVQNPTSGSQTLYVANLSYEVGEHDLSEFFKGAGEVVGARLATRGNGRSKGFGHVDFATEEDVKKALELNGQEFFGRALKLEVARERDSNTPQSGNKKGGKDQSHSIFVKGFDKSLGLDQAFEDSSNSEESFEKSSDEESEDEKPLEIPKKNKDVEMKDATFDSAQKQTKMSEKKVPKTPTGQNPTSGSQTLYVGNLSYDVGEHDLLEFFRGAGEVVGARIATRGKGSSKGFGHVDFATEEDVKKALELNGQEFFGRALKLEVAHERDSNTPQSGNEKDGKDQSQTIFVKGFDKSLGHDQIREKGSKDQSQTIFVKGFDKSLRHDQIREKGGKDQSQTIFVKGFDKSLGHDQIRKKGGKDQSQIIFVKGFDKSLGYDQIRNSLEKHFGSCGDITRISILRNHESGAPKGMAFLDFKDQNACNEALKLNGSELGGRTLTVDEGKPKGDNSDGRGKGGGKFSGRGGGRGGRGDRGRGRGSRGRGRGRGGERVGRGDRSRGRSSGGRGRRRGGAGKNFSDSDD